MNLENSHPQFSITVKDIVFHLITSHSTESQISSPRKMMNANTVSTLRKKRSTSNANSPPIINTSLANSPTSANPPNLSIKTSPKPFGNKLSNQKSPLRKATLMTNFKIPSPKTQKNKATKPLTKNQNTD